MTAARHHRRALALTTAMALSLVTALAFVWRAATPAHAAMSAYIPATPYRQAHALSCESAALHIALAARGVDVDENWLQAQYGTDLRAPVYSGGQIVEWGNPYLDFVGNVNGNMAQTGYGVYETRVVVAAHRAGVHAWGAEGWNPDDLYAEIAMGNPVVVWVTWSLEPPTVRTISTFDGRSVWFSGQEHAQTLIGFDKSAGTITLADPLSGNLRTFPMGLFEQRFAQFHSGAVVIGSGETAPVVGVRGSDGELWTTGGNGWTAMGGALIGPPAVVHEDDGTTLYIATGTDHGLWIRSDALGWKPLSQSFVFCRSGPGAAAAGALLVVACEGGDGALWVAQTNITPGVVPSVGGFSLRGGVLASAPAVGIIGGVPTYLVTGVPPQTSVPPPAASPSPSAQAPTPTPTSTPTATATPTQAPNPPQQPAPQIVFARTDAHDWWATGFTCVDSPALAQQDGVVLFACHGSDDAVWFGTAQDALPQGANSAGGVVRWGVGAAPVSNGFAIDAQGTDDGAWDTRIVNRQAQPWSSLGGVVVGGVRSG